MTRKANLPSKSKANAKGKGKGKAASVYRVISDPVQQVELFKGSRDDCLAFMRLHRPAYPDITLVDPAGKSQSYCLPERSLP